MQTQAEQLIHDANVFRNEAEQSGDPLYHALADLNLYRLEQLGRAHEKREEEENDAVMLAMIEGVPDVEDPVCFVPELAVEFCAPLDVRSDEYEEAYRLTTRPDVTSKIHGFSVLRKVG